MVNLFEHFNMDTQTLYDTLRIAGHNDPTIVLVDDGFLPEDIITPYSFFANYQAPYRGRGRYFNEVPVPRFWEIAGNNSKAWVKDLSHQRATIYYHSSEKRRIVSHVEWCNQHGQLQFVDHYNQHGLHFAQTVYDLKGKKIFRRYMDQEGREVIYENFIASSIILTWKEKQYHFNNTIDFFIFFLKAIEVDLNHCVINSLSTPFLILYHLDVPGQDTLFWQETSQGDIPGNMRVILEKRTRRPCRVLISQRKEYDAIAAQLTEVERSRVAHCGYLYTFQSQNQHRMNILTMTNSDQIENLEKIVQACPFATFYIGAVTEMSQRLTQFECYSNVVLYPTIKKPTIEKLYHECDVYLDINNGTEIINAVRKAFDAGMLILGYTDIVHQRRWVAPENLFAKADGASELIRALKDIHSEKQCFKVRQSYQQLHTNATTVEAFNKIYVL
ncbi:TPA: accessory Sec system glycosylation chaperone GtfB [Staphylococcus delphini]|nr:accessory Sec system glycosylation chaperone GtfB [Staphylococcus delphini]HEC2183748.1 accessory Sec system glycosylation chaperone GtfB [Staphylococcus delphini]HEC2215279.1 accessory Sec system glycosylation chaperone GtfB [Staphylococcus delphini]